MKIRCYSESPAAGPGGAEHCVATVAEELSREHDVEIVHHKPAGAFEEMAALNGFDLRRVTLRHVPLASDDSVARRMPWSRCRAAREWRRELSEGCDVFLAFVHQRPPFCRARRGVLVVLFPTHQPFAPAVSKKKTVTAAGFKWRAFERVYAAWEWRRRMATYAVKASISEFTREAVRERWRVKSEVLAPPVETTFATTAKEPLILSVGRFAVGGCAKKQGEMIGAFRLLAEEFPGWRYACVGGLSEQPAERAFFTEMQTQALPERIEVRANLAHSELRELYARAAIFWHAAGLGEDAARRPERMEHFGMATVEAMAAGCVPLVVNRGAQPELVEHGVSGWVWETLEELREHTRRLAGDPARLARMSAAARERAQRWSRPAFFRKLQTLAFPK